MVKIIISLFPHLWVILWQSFLHSSVSPYKYFSCICIVSLPTPFVQWLVDLCLNLCLMTLCCVDWFQTLYRK
jgi:hypothetical protein